MDITISGESRKEQFHQKTSFLEGDSMMQQFNYTIQNPVGMDVRRIGLFTKLAKRYTDTTITVAKGNQTVKAGQLMKLKIPTFCIFIQQSQLKMRKIFT